MDALCGVCVNSLRLTFWTTMSTSSADGLVMNVSRTRLCSFWAIVASARAGLQEEQGVRVLALDRRRASG